MAQRQLQFKPEAGASPCPTCGNAIRFAIVADRAAEDCCDVYLRCVCGEYPDSEHAVEDVWGDISPAMAACAIQPWNDWCQEVADGKKQTLAQMATNR